MNMKLIYSAVLVLLMIQYADSGPITAGICYAACGAAVCACFALAGFTFGTVPGAIIAATPALAGCNAAFAACEAACMAALVVPSP